MKIGLDFDGVIGDSRTLMSVAAEELHGVKIPPGLLKKETVVAAGLALEDYRAIQKLVYGDPEVGMRMEPVGSVLHFVPQLLADGHTVLVVTSRVDGNLEIAKTWSVQHGLQLDFVGVSYGNSKVGAANGLDVYIDDDFEKLEPLIDVVPHLFLYSWDHNLQADLGTRVGRVASWKEFYDAIKRLAGDGR